ncbi:MAG: 1-acyl-sn-glycerol-3-phosphate acyltransferase [Gammaproteobacteria bacterium]|nr:1-acyl-sn-glycerol-3-phosphate acyltransferase [Gammaproteobacteria bacterium]MDH5628907.1 1-acyl-sn-glycerol-3-phosphate acyltransferase [Gammaproteobacteria bacterium]
MKDRKSNKASKLRFYWIAFMTGVYTFIAACHIAVVRVTPGNTRNRIDKLLRRWSRRLLGLLNVSINSRGAEKFPHNSGRPVIVMSNHFSLYDIPVSILVLETSLRMMAKKELYKIPFMGMALRLGEFVSVDRHNHEQSIKDLEKAKQVMVSGISLWVAPEGTRSRNGTLGKFKRGVFHLAIDTKAIVVPIVIKNIHEVQSGNNMDLYLNQEVFVEVCDPVDTKDFEISQRAELLEQIRHKMQSVLDVGSEKMAK